MINELTNSRLTQTGAHTAGGQLLRRYWQPLFPEEWITDDTPLRAVKILGESLVVFKESDGSYGSITEKCPHRGASLEYGYIEDSGIRCSYHGWLFSKDGRCKETPFEPRKGPLDVRTQAYPVVAKSGLLFIYMGPDQNPPTFPQWDIVSHVTGHVNIQLQADLKCNWLQIQENAADVTHTTFLHSYRLHVLGLKDDTGFDLPMKEYGFQPFEWGILKSWIYDEDGDERLGWGNLLVFPNMLRLETEIHWRIPIDDRTTRVIILGYHPGNHLLTVEVSHLPERTKAGQYLLDTFYSQDAMAWETAGQVYDRTAEHLGASDVGISMFRRELARQLDRLDRGEDPDLGVAANDRVIDLRIWMGGYLPMSAPKDPTISHRLSPEEIFDTRMRKFSVPEGKARRSWKR